MTGASGAEHRERIEAALKQFVDHRQLFENIADALLTCMTQDPRLGDYIHFTRSRVKTTESLRAKLEKLARVPASDADPVTAANLFSRVTDLAGVRIIHLHMEQLQLMHSLILKILEEEQYELAGSPTAHCWDVEYEELFKAIGIRTRTRQSLYTTVHYDVVANPTTGLTCELQVRPLLDEVWGEVSHRVNYPAASPSRACQDQLKVLARLTTGCGRLVDSIFRTHNEAVGPKATTTPTEPS